MDRQLCGADFAPKYALRLRWKLSIRQFYVIDFCCLVGRSVLTLMTPLPPQNQYVLSATKFRPNTTIRPPLCVILRADPKKHTLSLNLWNRVISKSGLIVIDFDRNRVRPKSSSMEIDFDRNQVGSRWTSTEIELHRDRARLR